MVEGARQAHNTGYRESVGWDTGPNTTLSCTRCVNGMGRSSRFQEAALRKQNSSARLERLKLPEIRGDTALLFSFRVLYNDDPVLTAAKLKSLLGVAVCQKRGGPKLGWGVGVGVAGPESQSLLENPRLDRLSTDALRHYGRERLAGPQGDAHIHREGRAPSGPSPRPCSR